MINSVCGIGSTGRICTDIADALIKSGHECKIAYGRDNVPEKYKNISVRIGNEFGVRVNALKARLLDNEGFNAKSATKKFIEWVKEYDPDVIHLHNLHGYYINLDLLFSYLKTSGKKVIWTLHDCWSFTGHCSYFTIVKCEQWKTHCSYCMQSRAYPKAFCDRASKNFERKRTLFTGVPNMTIVTPSKWLAGLVKESFLKDYPVKVINNGIDLNVFKPTESNFREKHGLVGKKIILGVASVWDARKGLNDFIKLANEVDADTKIVLVGITKKQRKLLPANILAIERTNNAKELAEIYTTADVFFNPTYEDNYPTVNLEAQACGTPVITYPTGGSPESIPSENVVEMGNYRILLDKSFKYSPYFAPVNKRSMVKEYIELMCE